MEYNHIPMLRLTESISQAVDNHELAIELRTTSGTDRVAVMISELVKYTQSLLSEDDVRLIEAPDKEI